jgi:hypothetical protein
VFLTREDVRRITKRTRYAAQRRALDALGYRYSLAADGEPLVRESDLDGGGKAARNSGPRWDRLNAA